MAALLAWTGYTVFRSQSPEEIWAVLLTVSPRYLAAGAALMAGFVCCEARATHLILRALGSPQPYRRCLVYACAGFFFSNVTPSATGGQPAQVCLMCRDGVPASHGTLDMLLITIGYHTAVMGFGGAALLAGRGVAAVLGEGIGLLLGAGFVIFLALDAGMLLFLLFPGAAGRLGAGAVRLAVRLRPSLDRGGLETRLAEGQARYRKGTELIRSAPGLLPRVLLLCAGQQACAYAVPYLVCRAMGVEGTSFWTVFALQTLCTIAVGYLPLPGSAGAAEGVFLRAFAFVFGADRVAPAMILSRTVSCYAAMLVTGAVTALLGGRRRFGVSHEEAARRHPAGKSGIE